MHAKSPFWPRAALAALAAISSTLFTACVSSYQVKVAAVTRGNLDGHDTSYLIANRNRATAEDTLRHNEVARHVRTALSSRGLYEAPSPQSAALIVEIDYGIAPPKMAFEERDQPVFNRPQRNTDGSVMAGVDPREVVDYESVRYPVVVREKHLAVFARENKRASADAPPAELWRVQVSIEDGSRDLRSYLPVLASAMMDEIGRTSAGNATKSLPVDDPAIQFVKAGM